MNAPRRHRGLSLVELLVTLVLVALTVSLVVGGVGQGSALLARVAKDQGEVYQELMARAWLRQTIAAAVTPAAGELAFTGNAQELQLTSFRPLLGSEGIATPLAWRAGRAGRLDYVEGDQQVAIEALPPLARIEYQDALLGWHERWPPGEESGLPVRVRLVFAGADDVLDVALLMPKAPPGDAESVEYDSE